MSKKEWAKKEIELLCKKFEDNYPENCASSASETSDYAKNCASAALEAFNFIADQGDSGCTIEVTKSILFDLLNECPLTPIEGADDEWEFAFNRENFKVYQNLRRSSLFKTVYSDGTVEYNDNGTSYCVDKNGGASYTSTFIQEETLKALSEQGIEDYCVKFPYLPNRHKLEIVTEDCMYDKTQKGDYDTIGILYANVPQRGKIAINKFYKETENGFEPISKEEYDMRTSTVNNDL